MNAEMAFFAGMATTVAILFASEMITDWLDWRDTK